MKKIGLIGFSNGNGHPYSFGSIINGYNKKFLKESGWDVIYNYVKKRDVSEIGIKDAQISHVWTQNIESSKMLSLACKIPNILDDYTDMIGEVDGVIIARDDYEKHLKISQPFLESGIKVFIDKPLTLDLEELRYFKKYILSGQLMSMSSMRYAMELDDIKYNIESYGELKLLQSNVVLDWEKYGIHMLDAVLGILPYDPISIEYLFDTSYIIEFKNGLKWSINILGNAPKTFNINVWGTKKRSTFELNDNFTMFRRLMWRFIQLVDKDEQYYIPKDIILSICLLIGGQISRTEDRKVFVDEFSDVIN